MFNPIRSLELRLTLLATTCAAMVLCTVALMTYLGINQILITQQDRALVERIERLEILLQDSRNIEFVCVVFLMRSIRNGWQSRKV